MYERYAAEKGLAGRTGIGQRRRCQATRKSSPPFRAGVFSKLVQVAIVRAYGACPKTETGGRIHTSAATVAVLPEAEDIDIEIRNGDITSIRCELRALAGSTSARPTRLRAHIPTGIMVVRAENPASEPRPRHADHRCLYDMERQKAETERSESRRGRLTRATRSASAPEFPTGPCHRSPHQPDAPGSTG